MKICTAAALLIALGLAVSGCAGLPEVPYDRTSTGNIKTIAIVTPSFPKDATVILATSVGQSFGLVGALVDAGLQTNRDNHFKAMLQQAKFFTQDVFMDHLIHGLEQHGFVVSNMSVDRPKAAFLTGYPGGGAADAYLDVVVSNYGYISAGIGKSTPYRPVFALQVRLIRAKDSVVLMQDSVVYNFVGVGGAAPKAIVTIAPNASYEFADFDSLEMNSQNAVKGLQDATFQSADTVSNLLK